MSRDKTPNPRHFRYQIRKPGSVLYWIREFMSLLRYIILVIKRAYNFMIAHDLIYY